LQGVEPFSFNSQGIYPQPTTATYPTGKEVCNLCSNILFIRIYLH